MELTDIERDVQTYRSKIGDLRRQTRDCMYFDADGTTKVQDPERLKALTAEITRLEEQLDHSSQILAKGSTLLGERKVADIETSKVYAQNRIIGIRAKVWHGLMEMLVPKIEIEQSIRGDLIFIQAGKDLVSRVLKSAEFEELKTKAESEMETWQETISDCSKLLESFSAILQDKQPSKTKKQQSSTINFDVDRLCKQTEPLMGIGLTNTAPQARAQAQQKAAGLVEHMGPIILDRKWLEGNQVYLLLPTPEVLDALNQGWLVDLGMRVPIGWKITKDGRIVAPDKN